MTASSVPQAGVVGYPIAQSLSPALHRHWLTRYRLPGRYDAVAVPPDRFDAEMTRLLRRDGWRGLNVTVPHKQAAHRFVDRRDADAERLGAVNTVVVLPDGTIEGRNTDLYGFRRNLETAPGWAQIGRGPAVVLGAGGAARAVVAALADLGFAEIRLLNRTLATAEALAGEMAPRLAAPIRPAPMTPEAAARALAGADLLANTTSLGMTGQSPLALALDALPQTALVTDIVYKPLVTDLLGRAAARGNPTVDGLGMLLHQAAPGFRAWFDPPQAPAVDAALRAAVLAAMDAEAGA